MKTKYSLQKVNYGNTDHINSNHREWTFSMDKITRVQIQEVFQKVSSNYEGRRVKKMADQKNVSWMMDMVQSFTNLGELVFDLFAGTCAVSKSYMLLPKHNRFIGCNKYDACIEGSKEILP